MALEVKLGICVRFFVCLLNTWIQVEDSGHNKSRVYWKEPVRLVYQDVRGLSATETCPRARICGCTMPKEAGPL